MSLPSREPAIIDRDWRISEPRERPASLSFSSGQLKRVVREYELQVAVQEAQNAKTVYALHCIVGLHEAGLLTKRQVFAFFAALDTEVDFDNDELNRLWHESARQQLLECIDQIHKCVRLGAAEIARLIDKTLDLPPPKPGLLLRIWHAVVGREP